MMGQDFKKIENEIKSLSGDKIEKYWIALHDLDQENAIANKDESRKVAIVNLFKTAALIKYHGYPVIQKYNDPAPRTPWAAWIHCPSGALKQYTFPIILEGRDKGQLPATFFPDYFVGGFILDNYGMDMVYDEDFFTNGISPVTRFLHKMEEDRHEINLEELQLLSEDAIKLLSPETIMEIGRWEMLQNDEKTYFRIRKIKKDFYLEFNIEKGRKHYSLLKFTGNNTYEFIDGYGFYTLTVDKTLQFRDHTGKVVKTLQPVKI
jgi:hypothetical protein